LKSKALKSVENIDQQKHLQTNDALQDTNDVARRSGS
jgi:hypothetical protein